MARITVEDCLEKVSNRFLITQMSIKRVKQYREGYEPLVACSNKEIVSSLREIAAGKILPDKPIPEANVDIDFPEDTDK